MNNNMNKFEIIIRMIFRRLERPLTQMKTEGFTIKLKDPR